MGILEGKINQTVESVINNGFETVSSARDMQESCKISKAQKLAEGGKINYGKTSLYILPRLHRLLKSYCAEEGITMTDAINESIRIFLVQKGRNI